MTRTDDQTFDAEFPLCDPDGVVRRGALHHGTDYICTGHAHYAGRHIRCSTPFHDQEPLPAIAWPQAGNDRHGP